MPVLRGLYGLRSFWVHDGGSGKRGYFKKRQADASSIAAISTSTISTSASDSRDSSAIFATSSSDSSAASTSDAASTTAISSAIPSNSQASGRLARLASTTSSDSVISSQLSVTSTPSVSSASSIAVSSFSASSASTTAISASSTNTSTGTQGALQPAVSSSTIPSTSTTLSTTFIASSTDTPSVPGSPTSKETSTSASSSRRSTRTTTATKNLLVDTSNTSSFDVLATSETSRAPSASGTPSTPSTSATSSVSTSAIQAATVTGSRSIVVPATTLMGPAGLVSQTISAPGSGSTTSSRQGESQIGGNSSVNVPLVAGVTATLGTLLLILVAAVIFVRRRSRHQTNAWRDRLLRGRLFAGSPAPSSSSTSRFSPLLHPSHNREPSFPIQAPPPMEQVAATSNPFRAFSAKHQVSGSLTRPLTAKPLEPQWDMVSGPTEYGSIEAGGTSRLGAGASTGTGGNPWPVAPAMLEGHDSFYASDPFAAPLAPTVIPSSHGHDDGSGGHGPGEGTSGSISTLNSLYSQDSSHPPGRGHSPYAM